MGACAGAFLTTHHHIERNPASGWFNVYKLKDKWVGYVYARGVYLRTSRHAEAWRAAVELEWLLDRWCREHGACGAAGAARMRWHRLCGRVGAGVPRSELVSNLPQLQAAGHVDAEGRLVKAVVVRRLRTQPAPRSGAPKPLVRVRLRCRRCARGTPLAGVSRAQVSVGRIDVGVAVEEARYERDAATGVRGEWTAVGVGGAAVARCRVTVRVCGRLGVAAQCGS
jgi:hypothetical protein